MLKKDCECNHFYPQILRCVMRKLIKRISSLLLVNLLFFVFFKNGEAQVNVQDSIIKVPLLHIGSSLNYSTGDLTSRFSFFAEFGGAMLFKTKKNWLLGPEIYFQFSDRVKETEMFDYLITENGTALNIGGRNEGIFFYQRGFESAFNFGKITNLLAVNPNSGLRFNVACGFWQHRIKFVSENQGIFLLRDEYLPGYDRLVSGFIFKQFIGYHYMGESRLVNFTVGLEMSEGFTKGRRNYQYDTKLPATENRVEGYYGIKLNWVLPFYKRSTREFYTY